MSKSVLIDLDDVIAVISNHHFDENNSNIDRLLYNLCNEIRMIPPVIECDYPFELKEAWENHCQIK